MVGIGPRTLAVLVFTAYPSRFNIIDLLACIPKVLNKVMTIQTNQFNEGCVWYYSMLKYEIFSGNAHVVPHYNDETVCAKI